MQYSLRLVSIFAASAAIFGCGLAPERPAPMRNWDATVSVIRNDGSVGCGVVIWEDGLILTNQHVVMGATGISVDPLDGTGALLPASVIATNDSDLALLRVAHRFRNAARIDDAMGVLPGDAIYGVLIYRRTGKTIIRGAVARAHFTMATSGHKVKPRGRQPILSPTYDILLVDYLAGSGSSGSGVYRESDGVLIGINSVSIAATESDFEKIVLRGVAPGYKIIRFLDNLKMPYHPARAPKPATSRKRWFTSSAEFPGS